MTDYAKLSDAELMAMYKKAKDPFESALAAEGVQGPVADIARSIYQQESSSGKNTKTSNAGAVGGMQIIPGTFKSVADKDWDINDPTQNARAGIRYVKQLHEQAGGDPALTAAGYYGGPGGLEKARRGGAVSDPRNPNAPTTLQYGQQVASRLPKEPLNPVMAAGKAITDAVIPSANAGEMPQESPYSKMSDDELLAAYKKLKPQPEAAAPGVVDQARGALNASREVATDFGKGAIRGTASIGNTITNAASQSVVPNDPKVNWLINPDTQQPAVQARNTERQAGLKAYDAEAPDSLAYGAGKLTGEIAGTAGVGGALAAPLRAVAPAIPAAAGVITKFANAIGSGGMNLGGAPAATVAQGAGNLALRSAGGAVTGAASAGLVDPETAKTGAVIGGAFPVAARAVAAVGRPIGARMAERATERAADLNRRQPMFDTLREGLDAGYVVPPSSVEPSLRNTVKESISGKIATAQVASSRNQTVTDRLVRQSLGLADDAPLTTEALQAYRTAQHAAGYEPVRQLGQLRADQQFNDDLAAVIRNNTGRGTIPAIANDEVANLANAHRSAGFDAGDAVDAIRILRENAQDAFRNGNTAAGRANRAIADAYENAIERAIPANQADLLNAYRGARANMARSFTVENALKEGSGAVDARKIAAEMQRGAPLDGELLTVARFANTFPKATQPPSTVNGPGVHNLKAGLAALSAGAGASALGPLGAMAGAAYPFLVPPAMRAQMFSQGAQRGLIPQAGQGNRLLQFANDAEGLAQLFHRVAPVAGSQ